MTLYTLVFIALSLAMDAFAIAVANGVACLGDKRQVFVTAACFGLAQAVMPIIGYTAGHLLNNAMAMLEHWVTATLLMAVGLKMCRDGLRTCKSDATAVKPLDGRTLLLQAFATSIDAMAVGVSLSFAQVQLLSASAVIGSVTFFCCIFGGTLGMRFATVLQRYSVLAGGILLLLMAVHTFLAHNGYA